MPKAGIRIETFVGAGRYQHKEYLFDKHQESLNIPEDVVEMQRKLNERLWEYMPNGSRRVVSEISYKPSGKSLISRIGNFIKRFY